MGCFRPLRSLQPSNPSIRPSVRVRPRSWFLLIPKPEPEIDGLKMECAAAAAIVTYAHAT